MSLLASWLKQLILVVIIATILDLLLPSDTMQRYVRLVMGLVILVLILSPILSVIKNDWDIDQVLTAGDIPSDNELASIQEKTAHLKGKQQQWVEESVQKQIEKQIRVSVANKFNIAIENVSVTLAEQDGEVNINKINLVIDDEGEDDSDENINPVAPVRINVGEASREKETALVGQQFHKVKEWISQEWHVDETVVHIASAEEAG